MIDIRDGLLQIFNVDHGACALLTMPSGAGTARRILIDCGHASDFDGKPWYPGRHLASLGIRHVDLFVCTNFDEDHASGFEDFITQGLTIGNILTNPTVPPETIVQLKSADGMGRGIYALANHIALRRALGLQETIPSIPGVQLEYFYNPYSRTWDTENNLSLVTHLCVHGTNILFCGDMERDGMKNLLKLHAFSALMPSIHVLLAPHHGRENGRCPAMFEEHGCKPQLVVISDCAKKYQSQETVPYYSRRAKGVQHVRTFGQWRYVMTTRDDGEIVFRWEDGRAYVY